MMEETYPLVEFEESERILNIKATLVKNVIISENAALSDNRDYDFRYDNTMCFHKNSLIMLRETED